MRRLGVVLALAVVLPGPARAATAVVDVSVATLWKAPAIARPLDAPALAQPADPAAWSRNLATAALRVWLDSHVQTQALYGERVTVLARRGSWVKVAVADQPDPQDSHGYPGWLPARQLSLAPLPQAVQSAVVVARTAQLQRPDAPALTVSYATRLPLVRAAGATVVVLTPDGGQATLRSRDVEIQSAPARPTGEQIVAEARRFLGVHYLWGGLSAWGYDCSGLIWSAYRRFGMTIPRDADPQYRYARPVARDVLRPGDLLFFGSRSYVEHVSIYVGGGHMLEAPDSAHRVRIVPIRWPYFVGAGRI
jgi:cell wall-associated NlpC family hydrolase